MSSLIHTCIYNTGKCTRIYKVYTHIQSVLAFTYIWWCYSL